MGGRKNDVNGPSAGAARFLLLSLFDGSGIDPDDSDDSDDGAIRFLFAIGFSVPECISFSFRRALLAAGVGTARAK